MLRVISEEYVWLCRLISYLNIYHLRYKDISCRYLPGACDSCPSRWVPHNNISSDMQQLTMDLLEEWFQLVTSWRPILLIDTSLEMHNIGRNWCSEAARVSFNLHWLFHCVTDTHLTDGSTQRITEPCRLLGNTCPLLQTFHNHTHYLNSTPTYEQRHWCWLMQLLPQQKQTCNFWDWFSTQWKEQCVQQNAG